MLLKEINSIPFQTVNALFIACNTSFTAAGTQFLISRSKGILYVDTELELPRNTKIYPTLSPFHLAKNRSFPIAHFCCLVVLWLNVKKKTRRPVEKLGVKRDAGIELRHLSLRVSNFPENFCRRWINVAFFFPVGMVETCKVVHRTLQCKKKSTTRSMSSRVCNSSRNIRR